MTFYFYLFHIGQYLRDHQTFMATARYWTEAFARRSSVGIEEKVQFFLYMYRKKIFDIWWLHFMVDPGPEAGGDGFSWGSSEEHAGER